MKWLAVLLVVATAAAASHELAQQATQALEDENFTLAAELFEKALAEDATDAETRFQLAYAYTQLQQDEKAIAHYLQVVEAQPDLLPARANLGILLIRNERQREAIPHLGTVIEARPDDANFRLFFAQALFSEERFEEAIPAFQRAFELDPASADAALGLGKALARKERFDAAADAYRRAAAIDPELRQAVLELAETFEKRGNIDQALSLYREYLTSNENAFEVSERVGTMLVNEKRYEEAIEVLAPAVENRPTPASLEILAQAYLMTERRGEALPLLRNALETDPANNELLIRYATVLLHAGENESAAQHYYKAAKQDPEKAEAWNGLAFSLYKLENFPGTLKALAQASTKGPMKPAAIYLQAITQDKIQLYKEALASYEQFLATNPGMEDEEWKSRQRIKVINRVLEKGGR
jgi:tetratricopeptide (TPR) repeat protein